MTTNRWIRGGCIAAVFFMAAVLFVRANEIGKMNSLPSLAHKVEHFLYCCTPIADQIRPAS